MPREFIRFLGVGGTATALMYLLLILQVEGLDIWPVAASITAYLISAVFNYLANYHFTFASRARHRTALPRFTLIATAGLALNAAIMYTLTHVATVHYLIAQMLATGIVLLWNFFANRRWTYSADEA